ncbi:carbohydrate esterase family 4 protein [Mixia osmundae IAM 14324]|uniref:chitin deacetylase n=1 Tax=Mixia osmundae (strain CBS 9802 / IAM 14324 / JCM 22182 / KY 12970) TaxID=764103 RepID=G7EAH3_MIXOS|nr:carbohydrate esterase family 4 protein [Mixia osmundae IAM 14324]KEI42323.1 carbohydrate esterase family 4 protein [Mixia osmundae IAM 14324]GAA99833.1 hypothetical protein E5Q_06536 [Mixia osmundae IAM 14324]
MSASHMFRRATSSYPTPDVSGPTPLQAWIDVYNTVKASGLIPADIEPTTLENGAPVYADGSGSTTAVCSWTQNGCLAADDIVDAPDGMIGIAFDDGPQPPSSALYTFLAAQSQKATHFMIGSRIIDNSALFQTAVANGDEIASHTWSHPYCTSMTDMQLLGELGWTSQLIFDMTGRLPALFRPPYGDTDNRVRAIARHVFNLTTVIWNHDTDDWSSAVSASELATELTTWIALPKSPGLIMLEHELSNKSVTGFIDAYPQMKSAGWQTRPISSLFGLPFYQNSINDTSATTTEPIADGLISSTQVASTSIQAATSAASFTTSTRPTSTPASTSKTSSDEANSSASHAHVATSAIVGIALGAAALLALLLIMAALYKRRRAGSRSAQRQRLLQDRAGREERDAAFSPTTAASSMREAGYRDSRFDSPAILVQHVG